MKNQSSKFKSKILSISLILLLVVGIYSPLVSAAAVSNNLISNPSFETTGSASSTLPDQWTLAGFGTNDRTFTYPVTGIDGNAARVDISSYTDGDAKWVFNNVPITAGQSYAFKDNYMAIVPTVIAVQYTSASGTTSFDPNFLSVPASPSAWGTASINFTAPSGAITVTVFHLLNSVGSLTVDNYSLTLIPPPTPFDQGFASLTFDDGVQSQMDNAKPILDSAGMKATFYIVTHASAGFSVPTSSPESVLADTIYIYKDQYISNANSQISAQVTLTDNSVINADVVDSSGVTLGSSATVPASSSTLAQAQVNFYIPPTAKSVVVSHNPTEGNSLVVSNVSFGAKGYMPIQDILSLKADGQEIGAHTQIHPDLSTLGTNDAQSQVQGSLNELLANGLSPMLSFNYPYGNFNSSTIQIVQNAGFTSARSVIPGFNGKNANPFALTAQSVNANTTLDQVKAWIDSAKTNKTWLILVFHDITPTISVNDPYASTPTMMQDIVNYLTANNVPVHTISQGIDLLNNVIPAPVVPPTPTPTSTPTSTPTPTVITKTITLYPGWNLITVPVVPINTTTNQAINYTAETFGQFVGADMLSQWSADSYASHIVGVSTTANNFNITSGTGFFIHVTSTKNLSIIGTAIAQTSPTISAGWNLLGWASDTSTNADAFGTLMGNIDIVSTFNNANQQWQSHVMGLPLNNFTINQGNSVFMHRLVSTPTSTPPVSTTSTTATTSISTTSTAMNNVPNSSVEVASLIDATFPDQWTYGGWGTNTAIYEYINDGHIGSHSTKLIVSNYNSGDAHWDYAPQSLTRGMDYQFTAWYKTNTTPHVVVHYIKDNGSEDFFGLSDPEPDGTNNWQKYSGVFS
ncbi:MAG: polysaccharide deacetylase family protein, partial [Candidatus Magasanikbacteria bacterium]|nr:polysaccharide deacetylase family protein [Candidatus Magasanikbacteria bacterium]